MLCLVLGRPRWVGLGHIRRRCHRCCPLLVGLVVAREVARREALEEVLDQLLFEESRLVYPALLVLEAVQVQSSFAFLALLDLQPVLRRRAWQLVLPFPPPAVSSSWPASAAAGLESCPTSCWFVVR